MSWFPGSLMLAIGIVAWIIAYLQRARLFRWIYEAADRKFLKNPNLDVGLIFLMAFANLGIASLLIMPGMVPNKATPKPAVAIPSQPSSYRGALSLPQEAGVAEESENPDSSEGNTPQSDDAAAATPAASPLTPAIRFWQSISQLLVVGLMVAVAGRLYQSPVSQWGWGSLNRRQLFPTLRLGFVAFLLLVPPILFIHEMLTLLVGYEHQTLDAIQIMKEQGHWSDLAFTLATTAILVPIFEEILFRGIFQGFAEQWVRFRETWARWIVGPMQAGIAEWLGISGAAHQARLAKARPVARSGEAFWGPIIFSSLLFALAHVGQGAAPISLYLLAMGLGWLYRQTGNLTVCILVHAGLNATTLFNFLYF